MTRYRSASARRTSTWPRSSTPPRRPFAAIGAP
nr:MAG TPA: hypothetical protein [Caudoviricetes sp.]